MNLQPKAYVFYNKKYFPLPFVIFGFVLIGVGIYYFAQENYFGFLLILLGLGVSFSSNGLEIKQGKFRNFTSILFFRLGKWQDTTYKFLTYEWANVSARMYGGTGASFSFSENQYTFYLLQEGEPVSIGLQLIVIEGKEKAVKVYDQIALNLSVEKLKEIPV